MNKPENGNASAPVSGSVLGLYFLHAAVMGVFAGIGCVTCFGAFGIVIAVAISAWGVIAAIKIREALNVRLTDGENPNQTTRHD